VTIRSIIKQLEAANDAVSDGYSSTISHDTYQDANYPTHFCNKLSNMVCVRVPAGKPSPLRHGCLADQAMIWTAFFNTLAQL